MNREITILEAGRCSSIEYGWKESCEGLQEWKERENTPL